MFHRFYQGAQHALKQEVETMQWIGELSLFPIIVPIATALALKEALKTPEGHPHTTSLTLLLCFSTTLCIPAACISLTAGTAAEAALLTSTPFYMFYKGCQHALLNQSSEEITPLSCLLRH